MLSVESEHKLGAIRLSFFTALFLAILKIAVGILTNSVAILSLAVDSLGDLLSSIFNYFFLSKAEQPADADHHYGHGKFENFAAFIQGMILIGSASFVVYHAVQKLLYQEEVLRVDLGIAAIIICLVVSLVVGRKVHRVGHHHHSDLLKLEATHLLMDSYLYIVVLASLIFSWLGVKFIDPIASMFVAGYIAWTAIRAMKSSFDVLTDKALKDDENEAIIQIINDHRPSILGFDRFQTRRSGSKKFINFRVFICKKISLGQAHAVIDHIEKEISYKIAGAEVMIHAEPKREDCSKHEHDLAPRHFS